MSQLKSREEIPSSDKWCLEHIYASKQEWQDEMDELIRDMPAMEQYRGKLDNYDTVK